MHCHTPSAHETTLRAGSESCVAVASRRHVLTRLRAASLSAASGPLLVTGEAGSGKTWIARQLAAALPANWRICRVAITASLDALDFVTLVAHDLGLARFGRLSTARLGLEAALRDECAEGRRWLLAIDDAHCAMPEVWQEIQVFSDRLHGPEGFAALLVLSDTQWTSVEATRRFRSFAACFHERHHLPPLDLDETRELFGLSTDLSEHASLVLEELHRDAAGNPRRLLRLARAQAAIANAQKSSPPASNRPLQSPAAAVPSVRLPANRGEDAAGTEAAADLLWQETQSNGADRIPPLGRLSVPAAEPALEIEKPAAPMTAAQPTALIASKPPIRIEEGLVEVGWEGDLEAEYAGLDQPVAPGAGSPVQAAAVLEETVVDDPYATLQAWTEQAKNRQRPRAEISAAGDPLLAAAAQAADLKKAAIPDDPEDPEIGHPATPATKIRAEGQHEFGPYSQLFGRLRQSS